MDSLPMMALALLLMGAGLLGSAPAPDADDDSLRAMSFNIRYNNPDDGEHAWPHRKDRVAQLIRFHGADVVGVQEALIGQIRDLEQRLGGYAWVGVGRADGEDGGEFGPIFYRTDRLELLDHDTFWLSETPQQAGSVGWDAALPRVVTWARFRDRSTGAEFVHFNTHFDHQGEQARRESARLLVEQVPSIAGDAPVLVSGDFNATPETEVYRHLTAELADARMRAASPYGPGATFSGFEVTGDLARRIDYIFVRGDVTVQRFGTLTDQWRGRYPSDHLPVIAEVVIM